MSDPEETQGAGVPRLDAPTRALVRVTAFCRTDHNDAVVADRLAQSPRPEGADTDATELVDWLATAARDLGLRASLATARASEAVDVVRSGHPLLTVDPEGVRWVLLELATRGRISVTEFRDGEDGAARDSTREVEAGALDAMLSGLGDDAAITWLLVDPATPHELAVSPSDGDSEPLQPVQRLRRLLAPERGDIWAIVAFAVTIGVLSLATPIAVQSIVNSIALAGLLQPLIVVAVLLMAALAFAASLTAVQTWVVELIQRRLFIRTVADVAARLPRVRAEAYADGHGPELVNRFFDVVTVQKALSKLLIEALGVVLSIVVGLGVLAFYHPLLLAFDVVLLVVIAAIVFLPLRRGQSTAIDESTAKYAVVAWLEELARNPHAFKASGSDRWVFERSDALSRNWLLSRRAHFRTLFGQITSALTLQVLASTALLGIGGFLVIEGALTLGQLVASELIVTAVVTSVAKMGRHLEHWYDMTAGVHKIGYLLDLPLEGVGGEHPPQSLADGARLEIDGVSWRSGRGRTVFSGCDVVLEPGQHLAVTGPSGSGKTALLELLWRMDDPAEGAIRLDGRDYRDLARDAIHRDVALVSAVEVVQGTVRENIRLFRPFVSGDDVRRAIRAAGLEDAIAELPDGLDTPIHPSTRWLSKTELERLMLARALAGSPRVLLVDGLFDRLAREKRDRLVDAALLDRSAGRTVVLVTDDEELLSRCDAVLRLEPGRSAQAELNPDAVTT